MGYLRAYEGKADPTVCTDAHALLLNGAKELSIDYVWRRKCSRVSADIKAEDVDCTILTGNCGLWQLASCHLDENDCVPVRSLGYASRLSFHEPGIGMQRQVHTEKHHCE